MSLKHRMVMRELREEKRRLLKIAIKKEKARMKKQKAMKEEQRLREEIRQLKARTSNNVMKRARTIINPETKKKIKKGW